MNRDTRRGFLAGVLTAALALGLGGAALAAGRSIFVDDGISVTINGVPFTPRDAAGKEVPLFAYDGTTYAPIRAFSKAAGLSVDYDAATRTARVETGDYAAASDPNAGSYITADRAKELALADAGIQSGDALFLRAGLDWEDGRAVYDVEFCAGSAEYDYELDAVSGKILEKDFDCEDFDWAHRDGYRSHHGDSAAAGTERLTPDQAKAAALERLPGASVTKCELDFDDGRWVYELELFQGRQEYDCKLDATTGAILEWERD